MKFWTGVTDNRWFQHLANQSGVNEVNFWHPRGRAPFTSLPEGTPFLFKLKRPHHHIAGGGFFIKFVSLPLELAWDAFGTKNGAETFEEFERLIRSAQGPDADRTKDIGCSILGEPFFLPRGSWIPLEEDFAGNIVSGKGFDTADGGAGARIWGSVELAMHLNAPLPAIVAERPVERGDPVLYMPRRGQGAFRALVTNAYGRKCAITGESTLPVLEAAHIRPVASEGLHNTYNGLLLRSDFHKLFDVGLVTVTPDHRVEVSSRIKDLWFNGKAYNRLHGAHLAALPAAREDQPREDLLRWHNENVYERGFRST
jgi:putative restriction endonuclease